jgi:hypothetical protein
MTTTQSTPVITAPSMLVAQSVKLSAECEEWLKAKADNFRELTGDEDFVSIPVAVIDNAGSTIGYVTYMR